MNVIVWQELERSYYDDAVQQVNHFVLGTPLLYWDILMLILDVGK